MPEPGSTHDAEHPEDPQQPQRPTSATEWRSSRKAGFLSTLPSGNVARLRRTMDLLTLLRTGTIPNPLRGIINEMIQGQGEKTLDPSEMSEEGFIQFVDLLNDTVVKCVIEPSVQKHPDAPKPPDDPEDSATYERFQEEMVAWEQWEPEPGYLSTNDFELEDKMFIFMVAHGMASDLSSFREVQDQSVASVQDGINLQREAEQPSGGG